MLQLTPPPALPPGTAQPSEEETALEVRTVLTFADGQQLHLMQPRLMCMVDWRRARTTVFMVFVSHTAVGVRCMGLFQEAA